MTLSPRDVQALVAAFEASDWEEMTLSLDGATVQLSKHGRPPVAAADRAEQPHDGADHAARRPLSPTVGARLPAAVEAGAVGSPAEVAPLPAVEAAERDSEMLLEHSSGIHRVTAPSVGVFWRAPDPSAPPFVEVGQRVEAADPVGIVEVMKLFNHVQAGTAGTIRSIEARNGDMVEHGQTLVVIDVEG